MLTFFTYQRLLNSISILLLVLLAYQLSLFIWHNINSDIEPYVPIPWVKKSLTISDNTLSNALLIERIVTQQPFGSAVGKIVKKKKAQTVIQAPETQLNYKLRGIYFSDNELFSSAIIETKKNIVDSYSLKNEIQEGVILYSVALEHVVLKRYGKFETLTLENIKLNKGNKLFGLQSTAPVNRQQTALLTRYKKRFNNNPMALARKFRAIPVTENGKSIGFRLKALGGETLLKKLNVPDNVVFTSINGVGLDKPFQALDALKSLQTAKRISVTYLNNGNEETRDFEL